MAKQKEHDDAVAMRKNGKSLLDISKLLKISKGTASLWCRNIELTEEQKKYLGNTESQLAARRKNIVKAREVLTRVRTVTSPEDLEKRRKIRREQTRNAQNKYSIKRRIEIKTRCVDYKGGSCIKCGYNKCLAAMEFHHRNTSEKDFELGTTMVMSMGWNAIYKELDKCDLMCSNCHREEHDKQIKEKYMLNGMMPT